MEILRPVAPLSVHCGILCELDAAWPTFEPNRSISFKASHASLTPGNTGINHGSCFVQSEWRWSRLDTDILPVQRRYRLGTDSKSMQLSPCFSSAWISSRNMQWIHSQFPFILYASSVRRCWDVDACEQWVWHQARWHTARGCCGSLWAGVGPTHPHLERIRPFSVPHPLPRVSPSHLGVGRCSCSPQLDVTGIMEPHRAFTLHVFSKPPCTFPSRVFRCKIRSPTWVNEPRLCTCSTCLSVSGQAVLYSCAKNVFHAQLPELCLI